MKKRTILTFTILCSFLILIMPCIPAVNIQNVENAIEEKIEVFNKEKLNNLNFKTPTVDLLYWIKEIITYVLFLCLVSIELLILYIEYYYLTGRHTCHNFTIFS